MNRLESSFSDTANPCRLCGGATAFAFTLRVLNKHTVGYWRCRFCGSLQTEPPHWLNEAYASVHSATDTGMVARNIQFAQLSSLIFAAAGVSPKTLCLDWGGGNGLFCRMMRDQGFNFFNDDKYAEPFYCTGFTADAIHIAKCDVITSFEIFEHLPNPKNELAEILRFDPKLWLFSTQLYEEQGPDWNYFGPALGRHVFFYSARALRNFADAHGYGFIRGRHLHLLVKRAGNPYLRTRFGRYWARRLIAGGRAASLAAGLHFLARQRNAYRHWQADSDSIKQSMLPRPVSIDPR